MPSPFPGMDPWLERPPVFPTLHNALIIYLQVAVNAALPPGYVAANDSRLYVDPELHRIPDSGVFGPGKAPDAPAVALATLTRAGLLEAATEVVTDTVEDFYLEIRTVDDERLVTAVEVVCPANKRVGESGWASYQQKQDEFRRSQVNLVEIDLLRGGPHTTAVPLARLRAVAPNCDYHISVMVAGSPRHDFIAPIKLADRLPHVPIPLDSGIEPVTIDLQAVFDRCYDEGGFARRVKYAKQQPEPPLTREQQAWAEGALRARGLLP